jgi:hypothetical protein
MTNRKFTAIEEGANLGKGETKITAGVLRVHGKGFERVKRE